MGYGGSMSMSKRITAGPAGFSGFGGTLRGDWLVTADSVTMASAPNATRVASVANSVSGLSGLALTPLYAHQAPTYSATGWGKDSSPAILFAAAAYEYLIAGTGNDANRICPVGVDGWAQFLVCDITSFSTYNDEMWAPECSANGGDKHRRVSLKNAGGNANIAWKGSGIAESVSSTAPTTGRHVFSVVYNSTDKLLRLNGTTLLTGIDASLNTLHLRLGLYYNPNFRVKRLLHYSGTGINYTGVEAALAELYV